MLNMVSHQGNANENKNDIPLHTHLTSENYTLIIPVLAKT